MVKKIAMFVFAGIFCCATAAIAQEKPYAEGAAPKAPRTEATLRLLYVFTGASDTGQTSATGTATTVHCSNYTSATQQFRVGIRNWNGAVVAEEDYTLAPSGTKTASTHNTAAYFEDYFISAGKVINQGRLVVLGTHPSIYCTAAVINAASPFPDGVSLNGVRFSAPTGTQH